MGSWSVYCGVSQISITDGKKCVLLPLKKAVNSEYLPYMPATLPIFGTYGDYGDIAEIEENENTKLIEKYFNCDIQSFCNYLTSLGDEEIEGVENAKELKKMKFMFIDRKVYDFISSNVGNEYVGKGHLAFGNEGILKLLGFEFVGENKKGPTSDPKSIANMYLKDIDTFGDGLAEFVTIRHNLHCMSGYFAPYILYLTPQCGEFEQHQTLLDKFAEINNEYVKERQEN